MAKSKTSDSPDTTGNISDKKKTKETLLVPNESPKEVSPKLSPISKGGTRGG